MKNIRFMMMSVLTCVAASVHAQQPAAAHAHFMSVVVDPAQDATAAFEEMLKAYRKLPAIHIKSTLAIELIQDGTVGKSEELKAEFLHNKDGAGVVKIREFTCYLNNGTITIIHKATDDAYFRIDDDGSPYWALFSLFQDLPYPHFAILWGDEAADEVAMELMPATPLIVPTAVSTVERDGRKLQQIELTSDDASLIMQIDPKTKLIQSVVHEVTGGQTIQPGTKKRITYKYEYETFEQPLPAERIAFDAGNRRKADVLASLMPPPPAAPDAPPGGPNAPGGGGQLVGKPAPPLVLATMDNKAVDLEDLRGKVVVLDFWATWCGPCIQSMPGLHEVAAWTREQGLPVEVYTINTFEIHDPARNTPENRLASARTFWQKRGFTLPVAMDYTDMAAKAYGVTGIPTTVIIQADGVVHTSHRGMVSPDTLKQDIQDAINALESPDE